MVDEYYLKLENDELRKRNEGLIKKVHDYEVALEIAADVKASLETANELNKASIHLHRQAIKQFKSKIAKLSEEKHALQEYISQFCSGEVAQQNYESIQKDVAMTINEIEKYLRNM